MTKKEQTDIFPIKVKIQTILGLDELTDEEKRNRLLEIEQEYNNRDISGYIYKQDVLTDDDKGSILAKIDPFTHNLNLVTAADLPPSTLVNMLYKEKHFLNQNIKKLLEHPLFPKTEIEPFFKKQLYDFYDAVGWKRSSVNGLFKIVGYGVKNGFLESNWLQTHLRPNHPHTYEIYLEMVKAYVKKKLGNDDFEGIDEQYIFDLLLPDSLEPFSAKEVYDSFSLLHEIVMSMWFYQKKLPAYTKISLVLYYYWYRLSQRPLRRGSPPYTNEVTQWLSLAYAYSDKKDRLSCLSRGAMTQLSQGFIPEKYLVSPEAFLKHIRFEEW